MKNIHTNVIAMIMVMVSFTPANGDILKVLFSPRGGVQEEICARIKGAKKSIYVMAYDLTSEPIANALLEAQGRKISVSIVADRVRSLSVNSEVPRLARRCSVMLDGKHRIQHNKIMVFDQAVVLTGSYNFTKGGEYWNSENVIIIEDKGIAHIYLNNFFEHWNHGVQH